MEKLSSVGAFIALIGVISIILYFIGYNLRYLMWIDNWGPTTGWIIRGALVVVGGILFQVFKKK